MKQERAASQPPVLILSEITAKPRPAKPDGAAARGQRPSGGAAFCSDSEATIAAREYDTSQFVMSGPLPEMVAAFAAAFGRCPHLAMSIDPRCTGALSSDPSGIGREIALVCKQSTPYRPESMSQILNAGRY